MKPFRYEARKDINGDFFWYLFENESELEIEKFEFKDDLLDKMKFYLSGGGFAGFTPAFVLRGAKRK